MMRAPLLDRAPQLRRNQTRAELELRMRLRGRQLGAKFRRQYRIGRYIADFCCLEGRLVIELDGGQHLEQVEADRKRTAYMTSLTSRGFLVLRFWNDEVLKQIYAVLESNSARIEAKRSRVTTAIGIFKGTLTHTLSHI
jgi:very-short-patch-repair endonuclease